jgi:CBS-domain-containing membrane protein
MATPGSPPVTLPVRRRLTFAPDASTTVTDLVFCEPCGQSVPVARCATCGFGDRLTRDETGACVALSCSRSTSLAARPTPDSWPPGDGVAAARVVSTLPVGLALVRSSVCVAAEASLAVANLALRSEASPYGVAVVDRHGCWVGTLLRATTTLALMRSSTDGVATYMTSDWRASHEGATLGEAFYAMTSGHLREITVVDADRRFVGTLRDIDAMRFVTHVSRTGMRPPVERAA